MQTVSNSPYRIVVLLSGRGSNFQAILDHLEQTPIDAIVSGVVSDRAGASGLNIANEKGIAHSIVAREASKKSLDQFSTELADATQSFKPDLVVMAGFMRLVSKPFVERFENKVINIHPSLLPAFPGLNPQQQALDAGVTISGCTVHLVTEDMDAGPCIAQAAVPVLPTDTKQTLAARILEQEHRIYPQVVELFARGLVRINQPSENSQRVELDTSVLPSHIGALRSLDC